MEFPDASQPLPGAEADPAAGSTAVVAPPAIEAVGLSRSFGGVPVVHSADLRVAPGEITALIGPNGSGKTTLMLMLATLLAPDGGTIRIDGHDTADDTAAARASLGWMPDTLGSWPALTVREALGAVCAMYGLRGEVAGARVAELLERTGLSPLAEQRTQTLSRGQKQRLSLARALVHAPKVLLLDEPAAGLDPEARLAQRRMLVELAASGVAVLVTSHVLDELEEIATSVVVLRDGRTETQADVDAALRRPGTWRIRALEPAGLEAALAWLGIAARYQASLAGPSYLVELADESAAAWLLSSLVAQGVRVVDFGPASSALEQAFIHLAGEGAPAPPADPPAPPPPVDPAAGHVSGEAL